MEQDGVELLYGCRALSCQSEGRGKESITVLHEGKEITIGFDVLLCAVGRRPRSSGLGLEALGIAMRADGTIDVDRFQRTTLPNILAVGDVSGPWQLTHAAGSQGGCSALNALFGQLWRFSCRPAAMPRLLFTTPELARVGINESEAIAAGIAYEVVHFDLSGFDRAIADGETDGLVKLLCRPGSGQLLGATIVSDHAGEMIAGFNLAIQQRIALGKLLTTIYPYPSWSEVVRAAAGEWRRAHPLSPLAEQLLGAFHRWRRG
jgi:pyruvate/2-oxoglutarate dehydrogenase complex dihydrolipoamide dehydrogenase (E3) component